MQSMAAIFFSITSLMSTYTSALKPTPWFRLLWLTYAMGFMK